MFEEQYKQKQEIVEKYLKEILNINENPKLIYDAMAYSVFAGGKRLRPILCLSSCELMNGKLEEVLPVACAIELIHTYSLIHDDLPAMDNDDLRRGKPTNHKIFGEAIAILAGDALLNLGYEILIKHSLETQQNYRNILKATNEIAMAAGVQGMIGGQVLDILYENKTISYDELKYMHEHKTGALIEAAICSGAFVAGAKENDIEILREYAKLLGLAFQIKDDILDVTGNEKTLGKKIGSDEATGKSTFVTVFGLKRAEELVEELTISAVNTLNTFGDRSQFLKDLSYSMLRRDN